MAVTSHHHRQCLPVLRPYRMRFCLLIGLTVLAMTSAAADGAITADDLEATVMAEIVIVARAEGPAWWKVSKGDSVVWIMGWPPALTPTNLKWNSSTLKRRLKEARVFLAPPEDTWILQGDGADNLTPELRQRTKRAAARLRWRIKADEPMNAATISQLYAFNLRTEELSFQVPRQIEAEVLRAKVPVVRPGRVERMITAVDLPASDPAVGNCLSHLLDQLDIPETVYRDAATHWALGEPAKAIQLAPRGTNLCENVMTAGYSHRLIDIQATAIANALKTPGKAIAVAPMRQLVAEQGILQSLRNQGFTIADPTQPLED